MSAPRFLVLVVLFAAATAGRAAEPTRTLDLGDGVKLELVLVKAGEFKQGSPADEEGRADDETRRPVKITRDFYVGKYPVTRAQFERFIKDTNYRTEAERGPSGGEGWTGKDLKQAKEYTWRRPGFEQTGDHPVVIVTCDDALAFTRWLSKKQELTVQLPTEAQWEYACRAGTSTRFPTGDKDADGKAGAWCKQNAGDGTRPVGQKKANAWGLYDMGGNVAQWCRDWYGPHEAGEQTDPEQKNEKLLNTPRRVLRGGSWLRDLNNCRCAARFRSTPGTRRADNGFRVVAVLDKPDKGADPDNEADRRFGDDPPPPPKGDVSPPVAAETDRLVGVSLGSAVCLCPVVLAVVGVTLLLLLRRRSVPRGTFAPPLTGVGGGGSGVRIADDGFWLEGPDFPPDAVVRYRFVVNGETRVDRVVIEPGPRGTFVYTGGRPSQVEILEVVRQGATQYYGPTPPGPVRMGPSILPPRRPPPPPPPRRPDDQPFTGYPSAY
jgi:formylglycine-generating enzyme required for sulfatase activity